MFKNDGNVVSQKYWDKGYNGIKLQVADDDLSRAISKKLSPLLLDNPQINGCFEMGCFPGRYLAFLGKAFNLTVNGVDATIELDDKFSDWLTSEGISVGEIKRDDAFKFVLDKEKENKKYDLVYSLGFIEHFENYKEVIKLHDALLRNDGIMILATPNFKGWIQKLYHTLCDKANLDRHVVESMCPREWPHILNSTGNEYEVYFTGYVGGIDFWADAQKRNVIQIILMKFFNIICKLFRRIGVKDRAAYSPYCLLIAKKK